MNRLSLNQATTRSWSVAEAVDGCARAGITGIGLWREHVAAQGLAESAKLVRDAGLTVTSLCRGGFFTASDPAERAKALADNEKAIAEAATLGTDVLVLVSGGLPAGQSDVDGARQRVVDALGSLAPVAAEHGVRLAIEPLHPMYCSDRCVVSTLDQAVDIASEFPAEQVGVVVDTYHVWWDPGVYRAIERAGRRIASFQVADWVTPLPEGVLLGRAMIGDGCVELRRLREAVDHAGYRGPIEVEIFNQELWDSPGGEVLELMVARYREHVL
ncbi:sugar phosphate isomerase/epimerase [Herbihabitans rhizosphaerae]|uniref:Sugar phosphate isomerase/epimerase n=1 Tax=Herbihabitans rhizosphaerae TaxID=1872711 RepID=A0A4Q7KBI6_9PSEU|nr:sugar phosphate isomerase/epimerase family protein [Herbihabitans rhizosphaerae]RZS30307.1 sugar phosphate isomerase/epimerase [Herbihabitans rhizosphaerae]